MKITLAFLGLLLSTTTYAENRIAICHLPYKHDIFSADLQLTVASDAQTGTNFHMDTPTPYGIRTYQYDVSKLECGSDNSLKMEGVMYGSTKPIAFNYPTKDLNTGTLTYFDFSGTQEGTVNLECFVDKIKELCTKK